MTVIWRRTLYCKVGQTQAVTDACVALAGISMEADETIKTYRVSTDLSGRTDRVVTEIERETLVHPREVSAALHGREDALSIIQKMVPGIEWAEVEFLNVELSCDASSE